MNKTIEEWLEELHEPYRKEAIENRKNVPLIFEETSALSTAILFAFDWGRTPQGDSYWGDLYDQFFKEGK